MTPMEWVRRIGHLLLVWGFLAFWVWIVWWGLHHPDRCPDGYPPTHETGEVSWTCSR